VQDIISAKNRVHSHRIDQRCMFKQDLKTFDSIRLVFSGAYARVLPSECRYTPSERMAVGCVALFPTWLLSHMIMGQCELAC
jgi:hypothetical protein